MQIDRTNYETYFLDYIDGNLSVDIIDQFLDFLEKNPELKEELRSVMKDPVKLPDEKIPFDHKGSLVKSRLTESAEFDYRSVAFLEGDMTQAERTAFKLELAANPDKQQSFELLSRLKLRPDRHLTFNKKSLLLKKGRKKAFWFLAGSVAAMLIMAMALSVWFLPEQKFNNSPTTSVAAGTAADENTTNPPLPGLAASVRERQVEQRQALNTRQNTTSEKKPVTKAETAGPTLQAHPVNRGKMALLEPVKPVQVSTVSRSGIMSGLRQNPNQKLEYTKLAGYLADRMSDAQNGGDFMLANFARAGLQAAENLSKNKFRIEKNEDGLIREISYNSILLGFSIPVKKNR